jgi:hypothetical protein
MKQMHRIHRFVEFSNSDTLELPTKTHRVINNPTRRILSLSDILESGPTILPEVNVSAKMSDKALDKFRDALARSSDPAGTYEEDMVNAIKKITSIFLYRAVDRRLEQRPTKDGYKSIQGVINGELGHRDLKYLIQIKDHLEKLKDESSKIQVEWRIKSTSNGLTNINKYTDFPKLTENQLKSGYMKIMIVPQYTNTNTDNPSTTPQLDLRVDYNEYRKALGQKIINNPTFKEIYPGYDGLDEKGKKIFWKLILDNPNANQQTLLLNCKNPIERGVIIRCFPEQDVGGALLAGIKRLKSKLTFAEDTIDFIIYLINAGISAVGTVNPIAKILSEGIEWLHTFSYLYRAIKAQNDGNIQRAMEKGFTFIVYTIWNLRAKLLPSIPPSTGKAGAKIGEYLAKHKELVEKKWFWNLLNWFATGGAAKAGIDAALGAVLVGFAATFAGMVTGLILGLDLFKKIYAVEWVKSLLQEIGLSLAKVEEFRSKIQEYGEIASDFVQKVRDRKVKKTTNLASGS